MKKVYVKGYYGFKNIGDDVFVVTAKWLFQKYFRKSKPVFIGDNLPISLNDKDYLVIKNSMLRRMVEFVACLKVDRILYFGGSLFQDGGKNIFDLKFYFRKYEVFRKKLLTIGTSLGPFEDEEAFYRTKNLLEKFQYIGLRDYSSMGVAEEMGMEDKSAFVFDTAILIEEVYPSLKNNKKKYKKNKSIGISVCPYESIKNIDNKTEKQRIEAVKNTVLKLIETNEEISEVVLFIFNGHPTVGDSVVTEEIRKNIKNKINVRVVEYTDNTLAFLDELSKCDFILGVRLHSSILAYAMNIPFLLVEYHQKCTEFLNTINHPYNFDVNDIGKNVEHINKILEMNNIPGMIEPNYFKEVLIKEMEKIAHEELL